MSWIKVLLGLVLLSLILTHVVIPRAALIFTRFRLHATKIGPLSARGLEWRAKTDAAHSLPTLRVERIFWSWGGCSAGSIVTLNVEGVTFRVRQKRVEDGDEPLAPKKKKGLPPAVQRWVNRIVHLIIGNWSRIACLFSVRIADVRVVLEDLGGAEATVREVHFGLARATPPAPGPPPLNPDEPPLHSSPPMSPSVDSGAFTLPPRPARTPSHRRSASRMENFHRRASSIHSAVSKTASHLWSHATGSIVDRVTFTTAIHDVALVLPRTESSAPLSSSMPNLSKRASNGSFSTPRTPSFSTTLGPLNSLLKLRSSSSDLHSEANSEKLVMVEGRSSVAVCVGFGPNRPLLTPDNLRVIVDVGALHISLDGIDKMSAIAKLRPRKKRPKPPADDEPKASPWSHKGFARVILRAFEFATLSLGQVHVSHLLPVSSPGSATSSTTDMSDAYHSGNRYHTLSLDFAGVCLQLSGCNSSNNSQLAKLFGHNANPSSLVHGVAAKLQWQSIELQCIAPGETIKDRSELVAIRQAEFDVITTWRPDGWEHNDLLFADDVNLSVLLARGYVASVDVAGDLQLCNELRQSWRRDHPPHPPKAREKSSKIPLLPRIRVLLDIGPVSVVVANRASQDSATLTLTSDGASFGGHSLYSDVPATTSPDGQPPEKSSSGIGITIDAPSSPASLETPPDTLGLRTELFSNIEPISLRMTIGSRNEKTYRIATIGRIEGKVTSEICGGSTLDSDDKERYFLRKETHNADVDVQCEAGVRFELWHTSVIQAVEQLASLKEPSPARPPANILDRLPSGISLRLCLGVVSVFLGHEDPNPHCDLRIIHGLWLQTAVVFDYAFYRHPLTTARCRHMLNRNPRSFFRLNEDLTTTAVQYARHFQGKGGEAALFSVNVTETSVRPVFNGPRFVSTGGTDNPMPKEERTLPPRPEVDQEYAAWGWSGTKRREPLVNKPFSEQASTGRSFIRIPHMVFTGTIRRDSPTSEPHFTIQSRIERVLITGQLPEIYCSLLAYQTVRQISRAFKKTPPSPSPKTKPRVALHFLIPSVWISFTFPLSEAIFFSFSKLAIDKELDKVPVISSEHVLLHVQSASHEGLWDELGRIKKLRVNLDFPACIFIAAKAFRIRIPTAYHLHQLILNINICIKSVKLLATNLKSGEFHLEKIPGAEDPKFVPNLQIMVELLHLEARDHPVENKINLNNRVGLDEQRRRMQLEELFEQKMHLVSDPEQRSVNHLTSNLSVEPAEARWRLDWYMSRNWVKRIKKAREYERRREEQQHRPFRISQDTKLPIHLLPLEQCTPLFRAALTNVKVHLSPPKETRAELIQYMGDVSSAPFDPDQEFSLMVPFNLDWAMGESRIQLRDYPLPLLSIEPAQGDSWRVQTLFVIAEELPRGNVSDSCIFFPVEILPAQCGHRDAKPLWVQVAKTINPVKTYARPEVQVNATNATKITWCNSYSPGLTDVARMFDRLSSPPRDPSPKPGFWDKIRLILHWRVRMKFSGSVRFYLKGSSDPYCVTGYGSGFALVLRKNVVVEVGQDNDENELIQFLAEELLITIPDLGFLHDAAAVGIDVETPMAQGGDADRAVIERRSRKPCARFLNGVRFGLGFVFERTCRPWTCVHGCGETDNLLHRQCRIFDFKPHNQVTLFSPEAVERAEAALGHPADSYEGFRSDYIHFSVSLAAPRDPDASVPPASAAETHNSIHLSPKAFAHFFNWWHLFSSKLPAPIRLGKAFPDTPPVASKKFGRSLATIKYGCDLRPVFCSHMYSQVSEEMYAEGRAEYLGVKMSTRRMRIDAHQRMQEKRDWNEQLNRVKVITHKPFYAADLLLDDIQVVGIVADFDETHMAPAGVESSSHTSKLPHVSELPKELRLWFNYFDFIDADRKPFDRNPRIEIVSLGDCPHVFLARRIKARPTTPDPDYEQDGSDMEASKFGHENTHVCCLGEARGIGPVQTSIAQARIDELQDLLGNDPEQCVYADFDDTNASIQHRINTLRNHIDDLSCREHRQMDGSTLQPSDPADHDERPPSLDDPGELFQHTLHVHCPRLYINNASRNIVYKYLYSRHNRQKEEYTTSHASIRGLRDGMKRRTERQQNGLNRDDLPQDLQGEESGRVLLETLERLLGGNITAHFNLPPEFYSDRVDHRRPTIGLPPECTIHPSWRALVIKPQISLRSSADDGAVVLVAVEEISFQGFAIKDVAGLDPIAMDVLSRNYVALRDLQAFYPSKDVLARACTPDINTGQPSPDFLPYEVFLDVRSETTEYDRIVLKTDMSIAFDRFNNLRVPRGLEWPTATNDAGEPIEHLRRHQNATTIVVPMLIISARPNHYAALYYIVTDLLTYRDPQAEKRNDRINNFMYKFDQRDRDPQQLLATLFYMQQHIRNLSELQRGYEANVDLLTNEGKRELFRIRADLLHECDALFTVFEVINLNRAKDDARANARTLSRLDFRAGNIAWHMLQENGDPMVKFNIKHTLASLENNQDGSTDSAMLIGDLQALNSNADAIFPEVLSRWDKDKSKKKKATPFVSGMLCLSEQVAGIGIIRAFCIYLHPVRIRLEQEVGSSIVDYIFTDRTKRRREESTSTPDHPLSRTQSSTTISTLATTNGRPRLTTENSHLSETVPDDDAQEMRQRAKANRTFVSIVVGSTAFVLDYKRDDKRKHHGLVWPECADFRLQAPRFEYHNEILTFKELFDKVKSDIRASAWSQKGDIINQVFKKTSMFRSKKSLRQIAGISTADVQAWSTKRPSPKSPLRFTVQNTAPEVDEMGFVVDPTASSQTPSPPPNIFRSLSRRSDGHGGAGPALPADRRTSVGSSTEHEEEHHEHHHRGLIGKLMKHHHKHDHMEVLADDEIDDRASSFETAVRSGSGNGSSSGGSNSRQGSRSDVRASSMPPL